MYTRVVFFFLLLFVKCEIYIYICIIMNKSSGISTLSLFYLITSGFIIVIIRIVKNSVFVCFFLFYKNSSNKFYLGWIQRNEMMNMANELSRSLTFADMVNQAWLFFFVLLFSFFFSRNYVELIKFCPTEWLKVFTFFFILKILKIQRWWWWWLA